MNILKVTDCNWQYRKAVSLLKSDTAFFIVNEECQVSDEKFFSIKLSFIKLSYSIFTPSLIKQISTQESHQKYQQRPEHDSQIGMYKGDITTNKPELLQQTTPSTASKLRAFLEIYPNRNSPNMPPLKIDANATRHPAHFAHS